MIELTLVTVRDKSYSIKYSLEMLDDGKTANIKILNVSDVVKNSGTSFTRLKSIYQNEEDESFNTIKYKEVFSKFISIISKKYKINNIQYN